jgi:ECF sigma factor
MSLTAQSRRQNLSSAFKIFSGCEERPLSSRFFNHFQLTSETAVATLSSQSASPPKGSFVGHESAGEITRLLQGWRGGDRKALDALLPVVYKEPQRLAHFQLRKERPDHTLQSAALVNEAYLRLVGLNAPQWGADRISLPSLRNKCGRFLSITRAATVPGNAEGLPKHYR